MDDDSKKGERKKAARWRRVDALFEAALECPPEEREPFLATACEGDEALRQEVERLLAADRAGADFLATPLLKLGVASQPRAVERPSPGSRIGPFRLQRQLGVGGMGAVYLAVRDDGQYRRQVAIKVLNEAAGDDEEKRAARARRLRRELQMLARLEHPHIARLYDGGSTEGGQPYLIMEYVEGCPIDEYCDRHRLTIGARLRLFLQVCDAVHYAHQNLLVHRDIKPANILVTATGVPKLLDFGIAKTLAGDGEGEMGHTEDLHALTPWYASPEQIRGEVVTTASDVYTLGMLLFKLLVEVHPFAGTPHHQIAAALCERPPLSLDAALEAVRAGVYDGASGEARLSAICKARRTTPQELRRTLRGDLEAIVGMALRREPARRYGSAEQLAEDVRRHQAQRPVRARPESWRYRASRLVRRNRLAFAAGLVVVVLLAAFVVTLVRHAARLERARAVAEAERREAGHQRDKAERSLAFLVDLFKLSNPVFAGGEPPSLDEVLARGAKRVGRDLEDQPEIQARLLTAIGEVYTSLGAYSKAEPLLERAVALHPQQGGDPLDLAASLLERAQLRRYQGDLQGAESDARQALALRSSQLGAESLEVAAAEVELAEVLNQQADYDQAETLLRKALASQRRSFGLHHREVAGTLDALGSVLNERGDQAGAEQAFREALAINRQLLDADHPELGASLSALAGVLMFSGDGQEAEALFLEALAIWEGVLEEHHPHMMATLNNLAIVRGEMGDMAGEERYHRQLLAIKQRHLGDDHPKVAFSLINLSILKLRQGAPEEAEPLMRKALAIRRQVYGDDHPKVAVLLTALGTIRFRLGDLRGAETLHLQSLVMLQQALGEDHINLSRPLLGLGQVLVAAGDPAGALIHLERALALRLASLPAEHYRIAQVHGEMGAAFTALGRYEEAEELLRASHRRLVAQFRPGDWRLQEARVHLRRLYEAWGKPQELAAIEVSTPG